MTRGKSPAGIPDSDVAAYYLRRAVGGVGLIMSEGTYIQTGAGFHPDVPHFYGEQALRGWQRVIDQVHAAGGRMFPQLWHVGLTMPPDGSPPPPQALGPSGVARPGEPIREPMTQPQIDAVISAYGEAAAAAERLGFDGIEIHAAHGYLIDQFFWEKTNLRTDRYGGDSVRRTRFAVEVIEEIRRRVHRDYPVCLRFSQWKLGDYAARLAHTPGELEQFLAPLVQAGVDLFHCSQRRFWESEFEGSDLNLAGWTQKLIGKPAITVGSITLNQEFMSSFASDTTAKVTGLDELLRRMERGDFELVAVGRSLIVNPSWPQIVRRGAMDELQSFQRDVLQRLT